MVPIRRRKHRAFPDILLKKSRLVDWNGLVQTTSGCSQHLRAAHGRQALALYRARDRRTDRELLAEEDFHLAHERIFFDVDTRASAFILFAMGTVLFPTTSGDKMNVVLAEFVQNDDRIREYAWCEAMVAYL
ncbi:unnamed protein product [Victoria cruziana]